MTKISTIGETVTLALPDQVIKASGILIVFGVRMFVGIGYSGALVFEFACAAFDGCSIANSRRTVTNTTQNIRSPSPAIRDSTILGYIYIT